MYLDQNTEESAGYTEAQDFLPCEIAQDQGLKLCGKGGEKFGDVGRPDSTLTGFPPNTRVRGSVTEASVDGKVSTLGVCAQQQ